MERDLVALFEATKKAADAAALPGVKSSGPEVSRCIDALQQLKEFPVTYDTLVATQVGKKLRSIARHPVKDIKCIATDLIEIWKKVVIEETSKSKKTKSTIDNKADSVKDVEEISNPAPVKVPKLQRDDSAKSMKVQIKESDDKVTTRAKIERNESDDKVIKGAKIDHSQAAKDERVSEVKQSKEPSAPPRLTSLIRCNDPARDKIREILVNHLSRVPAEADEYESKTINGCDPVRVAVMVESQMFEKLGPSTGAQKVKYRSILFNLGDSNNPDFRRRVLSGEVSPENLVTLSVQEMASDKLKQETNKMEEKSLFECERAGAPTASTDQFKCGRCGQRKCTYYQMQTRSADEPMTTYVTCVNCDNHWKFC